MKIHTLAAVLFLVLGTPFSASTLTPTHDDANVLSIKRPYVPGKADSPQFDYRFRWIPAQPGKPTIVLLPGGPGGTSIIIKLLPAMKFPVRFLVRRWMSTSAPNMGI